MTVHKKGISNQNSTWLDLFNTVIPEPNCQLINNESQSHCPQILEPEIERDTRKSVNVTINVGKNERNVELSSEPLKKSKIERPKFKSQASPTRLSAKERLGEKVDDEPRVPSIKLMVDGRREALSKLGGNNTPRIRSPRLPKERRVSMNLDARIESPIIPNPERKVFVEDRKRDRARIERQTEVTIVAVMRSFLTKLSCACL